MQYTKIRNPDVVVYLSGIIHVCVILPSRPDHMRFDQTRVGDSDLPSISWCCLRNFHVVLIWTMDYGLFYGIVFVLSPTGTVCHAT